jgi:hypothetical protein
MGKYTSETYIKFYGNKIDHSDQGENGGMAQFLLALGIVIVIAYVLVWILV